MVIDRSVDDVWKFMTDISNMQKWGPPGKKSNKLPRDQLE
jgi:hypothetical protein